MVVKLGATGAMYSDGKTTVRVAAAVCAEVVDTTAAGDAFNAGFLAGWSMGHDMASSCRIGNALAGVVIRHPGAIVPAEATPTMSELLTHI